MMTMHAETAWQEAYRWLCCQRRQAPANGDVWHLRHHWRRDGAALRRQVEHGDYRLAPMQVIHRRDGDALVMWSAADAMVLKWVALRITQHLPLHPRCHHLKGFGCHHSLKTVAAGLKEGRWRFVYRTDIQGYYHHIRKLQLAQLIRKWVPDPVLCALTVQFIYYSLEEGGRFYTPLTGISRGCALSPLLGASLLYHVDVCFSSCQEVFYVRYMDDFLVLTETRWALRRAIKQLNTLMALGGFNAHPDKTQIGRLDKGFDWLGVWFGAGGPDLAPRALNNHRARRLRLYEQARLRGLDEAASQRRVQAYETRWTLWAESLLRAAR